VVPSPTSARPPTRNRTTSCGTTGSRSSSSRRVRGRGPSSRLVGGPAQPEGSPVLVEPRPGPVRHRGSGWGGRRIPGGDPARLRARRSPHQPGAGASGEGSGRGAGGGPGVRPGLPRGRPCPRPARADPPGPEGVRPGRRLLRRGCPAPPRKRTGLARVRADPHGEGRPDRGHPCLSGGDPARPERRSGPQQPRLEAGDRAGRGA
jgi:hypothetical protein